MLLGVPHGALADGQFSQNAFRLPPTVEAPGRCTFQSSAMGQANAARNELYDLRMCTMTGASAKGYDLAGAIMSEADFSGTDFTDAKFSKAYMVKSDFRKANFDSATIDRVPLSDSDFRQANFKESILVGSSFTGANLEGADFTDAILGDYDVKNLCKNPTLRGENEKSGADTRDSVGCAKYD